MGKCCLLEIRAKKTTQCYEVDLGEVNLLSKQV